MKTTINTCIMITVNNPSAAVMEYLAKLPTIDDNTDVTICSTPVKSIDPTQQQPIRPAPQDTVPLADIGKYLDPLDPLDTVPLADIGKYLNPPVQPQQPTQPDPQDTALRIDTVADIANYLDIGTKVHWHGAKFVFDGVVEKIDDEAIEEYRDDNWNVKILFIRRNDTDKLVSLTLRDLQTGRLTLID